VEKMSFNVYIPSYKRAKTCTTHKFLNYYTYVVRESEKQNYIDAGISEDNIWAVKDADIAGMVLVNDYIIKHAKEDIICIVDDDLHHFYYRLDTMLEIEDPDVVTAELERLAQIMVDLSIGFGSVDATTRPWNYTQEFDFKGSSGGMRWVNRKVFKAKLNVDYEHGYDLDVVLQELLLNRIILKTKYFCSKGLADTNEGGASDKKRSEQIAGIQNLRTKWGRYFDYNFKSNTPYIRVKR
jgi:hypothetical protein